MSSITVGYGTRIELPHPGVTVVVGGNNVGKSTLLNQILTNYQMGGQPFYMQHPPVLTGMDVGSSGTAADTLAWFRRHRNPRLKADQLTFLSAPGLPSVAMSGISVAALFKPISNQVRQEIANVTALKLDLDQRKNMAARVPKREAPLDPFFYPHHMFEVDRVKFQGLNDLCESAFGQRLTLDNIGSHIVPRVGETVSPTPRIGEYSEDYARELDALPLLADQGAGMVHMVGLLMQVMAAAHPILFIDEPEAFLHPPQAKVLGRALGELAMSTQAQIVVGTHDRNIVSGLLEVNELTMAIVRLTRDSRGTRAVQLDAARVKQLWRNPIVRYGSVLEGLFHHLVILCEHERDCLFYAAALDAANARNRLPIAPRDILFLSSSGVAGMAPLAGILRSLGICVVASPDIDGLRRDDFKKLIEVMEGDVAKLWNMRRAAIAGMKQKRPPENCADVLAKITAYLSGRGNEDFTADDRKTVGEKMSSAGNDPWVEAKKHGIDAVRGDRTKKAQLVDALDALGIVLVREGTLEGFARTLDFRKGEGWVEAAIAGGYHEADPARDHIARIVEAAVGISTDD